MAYTAWSVVFGEQPTAAKWNQLGANDAGFKDGTNIDASAITTAKIAALAVTEAKINLTLTAYTNSGTAGGTGYYISLGGLKILMIKDLQAAAGAWNTINWSTVGFTERPFAVGNAEQQATSPATAGGWLELTALSTPASGQPETNGCSILLRYASGNTTAQANMIIIGK